MKAFKFIPRGRESSTLKNAISAVVTWKLTTNCLAKEALEVLAAMKFRGTLVFPKLWKEMLPKGDVTALVERFGQTGNMARPSMPTQQSGNRNRAYGYNAIDQPQRQMKWGLALEVLDEPKLASRSY